MLKTAMIGVILSSVPVIAQDRRFISSAGDAYVASQNEHGGILTSLYPKSRFVENGVNSRIVEGNDVIYFGNDCDVWHKVFGDGTFGWANGGFLVEFKTGESIGFPRQDLPWENLLHCSI